MNFSSITKAILCLLVIFFQFQLFSQKRTPLQEPYIPGHLIVQIDEKSTIEDLIHKLPSVYEFKLNRLLSKNMRAYLIEFNPFTVNQMEALRIVNNLPEVTVVQNNHLVEIRQTPNDPQFSNQWHHLNSGQTGGTNDADTDIDEAWDITTGGTNALGHDIVVCILEQVNFNHDDLDDNQWFNPNEIPGNGIDDDNNGYIDDINGWDLQSNSGTLPTSNSNHGTNVAGMIGAEGNNSIGVVGANWNVKMMNVTGYNINSEASVVSAYDYPLSLRKQYNNSNGNQGAFVVSTNASWGIDGANPDNYPIWCAFYDTLGVYGILNCGATTNQNLNVDVSGDMPTACPSQYMVGVGRSDHNDNFAGGYGLTTIDFPAPGINVTTTANTNTYTTTTGTSFSSPYTAGVIALLYSIPCPNFMNIVLANPQEGADLVFNSIMNGLDLKPNMTNSFIGGGRLNAKNAMDILMDQTCSSCTPPGDILITSVNDNDASISYSGVADAVSYTIYISQVGSANVNVYTTSDLSYTFSGLTSCTAYEFYVETTCATETSISSSIQNFTTSGCGSCIDANYCATSGQNPAIFVGVHDPANVETEYTTYTLTSGWGANLSDGYAYGDLILVDDGTALPNEGCNALINGASINGNIAVALRGSCNFSLKALNAQNAGATALLLINNQGTSPTQLGDGGEGPQVSIPVVMISQNDGAALLNHLQGGSSAIGFIGQQSEWIEIFELNGISYNSGNDNGYKAPDLAPIELDVNTTYNFTINPEQAGQAMLQYARIWVDMDQNGVFDVNELLYDQLSPNIGPISGSLNIPVSATLGSTRMRVQMSFQGYGSNGLPDVCGDFISGEVEDYCLLLSSGIACGMNLNATVQQPACSSVQNGSIELNVTGGSPGYSYQWNNGAGNVSTVSNLGAGTYQVIVSDALGCDTIGTFSLVYQTNLELTSNVNNPSCSPNTDGEISVIATGGSGYTYQWTNGPTDSIYSSLAPGNYNILVTSNNGCTINQVYSLSYEADLSISANIINPSCTDFQDGSITVIASGGSGINYQWFNGPASSTYTNLGEGIYYVTATADNGCFITDTFNIQASPSTPTASFTYNQNSSTYAFLNASTNGVSYLWDFGDGNTSNSFNPVHTYASDGNYTVCLTVFGECQDTIFCDDIVLNTIAVSILNDYEINVYPNPVYQNMNIESNSPLNLNMNIYDYLGRILETTELSQGITSINMSSLGSGAYHYEIIDLFGNLIQSNKFIVLK